MAPPLRPADEVPGGLAARLGEDAAREARHQRKRLLTRRVLAWGAAAALLAAVALGGAWLFEERRVDGALGVVAKTPARTDHAAPGASTTAEHGTGPVAGAATAAAAAQLPPGLPGGPLASAPAGGPADLPPRVSPGVTAPPAVSAQATDSGTAAATDAGHAGAVPAGERASPVPAEAPAVTQHQPPRDKRPSRSRRQAVPAADAAADEADAGPAAGAAVRHRRPLRHTPAESRSRTRGAAAAGSDADADADADAERSPDRRREETLMQCRVLGYDERQCERHACEMTRFGLACRG